MKTLNDEIQKADVQTFKTKNTIPEKIRKQIDVVLQERLADSIDLVIQAKQAHWNVKGPDFIALHELFDKIAEESQNYSDLIAERIMQFGGAAQGTVQVVAARTSLPTYSLVLTSGKAHVEALAHTLATYGELIRLAISQASELNDPGTADILTEISRGVDKNLWFIEAHNQAEK